MDIVYRRERGTEGVFKTVCISADMWDNKTEDRKFVNGQKKWEYFVSGCDVGQNIKQYGHLAFTYSFQSQCIRKSKTFGLHF
jgi:hypothetical protein